MNNKALNLYANGMIKFGNTLSDTFNSMPRPFLLFPKRHSGKLRPPTITGSDAPIIAAIQSAMIYKI